MKTVLVCIISAQLLPNYLYVVEKVGQADEVLLIASKRFKEKAKAAAKVLRTLNKRIYFLNLSDFGVEEKWNQLIKEIRDRLENKDKYLVNLTGGTKYMAMAVQKAFEGYRSEFFYIPLPKNYMLSLMQQGPRTKESIAHRVNVREALTVFGAELEEASKPMFSVEIARKCLELFRLQRLDHSLFAELEKQQRSLFWDEKFTQKRINRFLENLKNRKFHVATLLKQEVAYLKGGWFEEYVYYLIKSEVKPDSIEINLKVDVPANKGEDIIKNEFDVCFTRNNRFYVIECKAFSGNNKKDNSVIYKSKALKESVLGMAASSYICAIGSVSKQAVAMDIEWFGSEFFLEADKTQEFINKIIKSSSC